MITRVFYRYATPVNAGTTACLVIPTSHAAADGAMYGRRLEQQRVDLSDLVGKKGVDTLPYRLGSKSTSPGVKGAHATTAVVLGSDRFVAKEDSHHSGTRVWWLGGWVVNTVRQP
eukprot:COSAG05_NODE_2653_length_2799_cov_5.095556_4_plen_115_part_00